MASKKKSKKPAKRAAKKPAAKKAAKRSATRRAAPRQSAPAVANPIVHWEIQSKMPDRLRSFYGDVFGWKIDANNPMNYGMVTSGGAKGIDGGIGGSMGPSPQTLVYASVPDINGVLDRVNAQGGRTIMPRTDVGPVIMAVFVDPEGNSFGVIEG
jgi:uncharacterized protein